MRAKFLVPAYFGLGVAAGLFCLLCGGPLLLALPLIGVNLVLGAVSYRLLRHRPKSTVRAMAVQLASLSALFEL